MKENRTRLSALALSGALLAGALLPVAPAQAAPNASGSSDSEVIDCQAIYADRNSRPKTGFLTDSSIIDFFFGLTTKGYSTDENGCAVPKSDVKLSIITPVLAILGFSNWLKKKEVI